MHTDQLEYFVAIAEQGSFTEASYELSISQSSLSKQINKLEEELNVKLFVRGRRQLMLTDAGTRFSGLCQRCITQLPKYLCRAAEVFVWRHNSYWKCGSYGKSGTYNADGFFY